MLAEERMITTPDIILSKTVFVTETVSALKHGDFICCATALCNTSLRDANTSDSHPIHA